MKKKLTRKLKEKNNKKNIDIHFNLFYIERVEGN